MGMYDTIYATIKCPYCGEDTKVEEQIKWAERDLKHYTVGDNIKTIDGDGIYQYGSYIRPSLHCRCQKCNQKIKFAVEVKDSKIEKIFVDNNDRPEWASMDDIEKYFGFKVVNGKIINLYTGEPID